MPYADRPELDDVSLALLRAADYIRQHGWCRNRAKDEYGSVCVVGAIAESLDIHIGAPHFSVPIDFVSNHVAMAAWSRLNDTPPFSNFASVQEWNDKAAHSKEEVIAALEAAAHGDY